MDKLIQDKIYSGVLGKFIGVYLGRPVEGWSYDKIRNTFDTVDYYVNDTTKAPLIVPDDDISGTFAFVRAMKDNNYDFNIQSKAIGDTWLNYIIENQTILWFGGLSRSTEHTAFLRLKNGINAPRSGSIELNGEAIATQIGSQIFIDSWAMLCPNDPSSAAKLAKQAAMVSHGGIAVDAAVYLAAMEAEAFGERNIDKLLDNNLKYVNHNKVFTSLVDEIRNKCAKEKDWRVVRDYIEDNHGYQKYMGNCPIITNHLSLLMSLIYGGDSFNDSISIATSAGWDTDCNAGNVGALNGIRLGLESLDDEADFRSPVKDRALIVTSDGGSCISDAVIESKKLINCSDKLYGTESDLSEKRYSFEFSNSVQGFMKNDDAGMRQTISNISNSLEYDNKPGLKVDFKNLSKAMVADFNVETFTDLQPKGKDGTSYFEVFLSPSIYSGQTIKAQLDVPDKKEVSVNLYIDYYNDDASLTRERSDKKLMLANNNLIDWLIPDTNGFPIFKVGFEVTSSKKIDGSVVLRYMDFKGAPKRFFMPRSYEMTKDITPWTTNTIWLKTFMNSATSFYPDYTTTLSLSHPEKFGVVTIGSLDWDNYRVSSKVLFLMNDSGGLVARSEGHRRFYSLVIEDGSLKIIMNKDRERKTLAQVNNNYKLDTKYELSFEVKNNQLKGYLNGELLLTAKDDTYSVGAAGFIVDTGAVLIDTMLVEGL